MVATEKTRGRRALRTTRDEIFPLEATEYCAFVLVSPSGCSAITAGDWCCRRNFGMAALVRVGSVRMSLQSNPTVYTFTITGGPCAGKTSALAHLLEHQTKVFPQYDVDVVPEAATLYHQYGARLPFGMPPSRCGRISADERNLIWELLLNELKRTLEVRTVNAALTSPRPSIVLCDRGVFDSRAYLPTEADWASMLALADWQEEELASRYDHVFHLKMCPEAAYTAENNAARRETFEEALALDRATWDAWEPSHGDGRGQHSLIGGADGDDSFEGKLEALTVSMTERVALLSEADAAAPRGFGGGAPLSLRAKRRGWYLPPDAIIALADTVASAEDLGPIYPTAASIVKRIARVDAMLPARRGVADDAYRESAWRSAAAIGESSGLYRDVIDPDSPLAF